MYLLLVQHGESKSEKEDSTQSLNATGEKDAEKMAKWLFLSKVQVSEIRHSGKKRAEQTASIFAKYLMPSQGIMAASGLNPMDDVRKAAQEIKDLRGPLMLVGHLPFMSRLTGYLVAGDPERELVHFQNAGVVCLRQHEGRWTIEWIVIPDLIR